MEEVMEKQSLPWFRKRRDFEKGDRIFWVNKHMWGWVKKILPGGKIKFQPDDKRNFFNVPIDELVRTAKEKKMVSDLLNMGFVEDEISLIKRAKKVLLIKLDPIDSIPKDIEAGTKLIFYGHKPDMGKIVKTFYVAKSINKKRNLQGSNAQLPLSINKKLRYTHRLKGSKVRSVPIASNRPNAYTVGDIYKIEIG